MMKEREPRWIDIANRLAKRGDSGAFYSAVDAATLNTQISVAAAGQTGRGTGGASAAARSGPTKRSGVIRPGSGSRPGGSGGTGGSGGGGTGTGGGTETAVMDRPSGGGSGSSAQSTSGPRPRKKSKGKRRR